MLKTDTAICGYCDYPVALHTDDIRDNYEFMCPRDKDALLSALTEDHYRTAWVNGNEREAYVHHYVITEDNQAVSLPNVSGPAAQSGSNLMLNRFDDETGYFGIGVDDASEIGGVNDGTTNLLQDPQYYPGTGNSQVASWTDGTYRVESNGTKEWACTTILGEEPGEVVLSQTAEGKRSKRYQSFTETQINRSAYVEGDPGYLVVKLIDFELTKRYQNRLLNVFRDKQNRIRVGSIVLSFTADTITAKCVQDTCRAQPLTIDVATATREDQELFVFTLIAHGNNHAARWFKERETYYKVHRFGCVIANCNDDVHYCLQVKDPEERPEVDLLVDHYRNCKTPGCACTETLLAV